jgi:TetR/AcrR family transcriptional regulator, transcriptional repressor for nem operon
MATRAAAPGHAALRRSVPAVREQARRQPGHPPARFDTVKVSDHLEDVPAHSKRAQLIEGGLDLIHREGFARAGVAAITASGGAPKGSFYNHFESKDAFGVAVLDKYFEEVAAELQEALHGTPGTPLDRIRGYFALLRAGSAGEGFARGCLIGNLSAEVSPASPVIRAHLRDLLDQWTAAIAAVIQEAQDAGQARTSIAPATLAALLIDSWQGALLRAKVNRTADSIDAFIEVLLPALLSADRTQPQADG